MPKFKFPYQFAIVMIVLSIGPLMITKVVNLFGRDIEQVQRDRTELCRNLATECSIRLPEMQMLEFQQSCQQALLSGVGLQSLRVIRHDGAVLYESDGHKTFWKLAPTDHSTSEQVRIPLMEGKSVNAEMELAFEPIKASWVEYAAHGLLIGAVFLGLNFGSVRNFFVRRFRRKHAGVAVPKRVRNTLDTLVGGVVILDESGRILLANDSFAKFVEQSPELLKDQKLSDFRWCLEEGTEMPWGYALRERSQQTGVKLQLAEVAVEPREAVSSSEIVEDKRERDATKKPRTFMVNATPIFDSKEGFSGALVSFEDISVIEEQRQHLLTLLSDLEVSREQIHRQNQVLHELASRDGLTGALNRRSLFEKLEQAWENRHAGGDECGLGILLLDVDHFKKLNDRHGHLIGDKALKDIAKTILRIIHDRGWFARYGGEEFCIVSERTSVQDAMRMAEEIRKALEIEHLKPYKLTVSIGVSSSTFGSETFLQLLEQADRALYSAKQNGRNCVSVWSSELDIELVNRTQLRQSSRIRVVEEVESRISYHAVIALNSAISCRYPEVVMHSYRVSEICVAMARSWMPASKLYTLEAAALLHDVGVMSAGASEVACERPFSIDSAFSSSAKQVAEAGAQILRSAFQCRELVEILAEQAVPSFAKARDGRDRNLSDSARVLAIANSYDHLVNGQQVLVAGSNDKDRKTLTHSQAIEVLRGDDQQRFDPVWIDRLAALGPVGLAVEEQDEIGVSEASALMFGYQIDRVIHCLETRRYEELRMRLQQLENSVGKFDVPKIAEMLSHLRQELNDAAKDDWESLVPTFRDLVEICLTIQRAYLKKRAIAGQLC